MANYNTNQARHLYVAKDYKTSVAAVEAADPGTIAVLTNAEPAGSAVGGHPLKTLYFVYKNGDGLLTRSDTIPVCNIEYVTKKAAAEMDYKLIQHVITLNDGVSIDDLKGKTVTVNIAVRGIMDDDPRNVVPVVATVKVGSSDTAAKLYKNLADAIAKAVPTFGLKVPMFRVFTSDGTEVTKTTAAGASSTNVTIVATAQNWRRGLLSNKPYFLTISFGTDADIDNAWGKDVTGPSAVSNYTVIASAYELADLEYFCYGERGDDTRMAYWPNNYEPTYLINPADTSTTYDLLTIQYFWQGHAENIQKSPRTIHIAAPAAKMSSIYAALLAACPELTEASGSGSGA